MWSCQVVFIAVEFQLLKVRVAVKKLHCNAEFHPLIVVALIEEYQNAEFYPLILAASIEGTPTLNSILSLWRCWFKKPQCWIPYSLLWLQVKSTGMQNSILTLWLWWTDCKTEFISATVAYIILFWIILFTAGALHYSFVVSSTCRFSQTPFMVSRVWMQVLFDTCLQKKPKEVLKWECRSYSAFV